MSDPRQRVLMFRHPVDMRRQIDGLAALVTHKSGHNLADRCLYVFTNKGRDKVKLLIWHLNRYWLLYKRLNKQRFRWPNWFDSDTLRLTEQKLDHLLDSFNTNAMRPHQELHFAHAIKSVVIDNATPIINPIMVAHGRAQALTPR